MAKKKIIKFETVHERKDGSTYPVEVHLQLIETQITKIFTAIIMDITERINAEDKLKQAYEKTLEGWSMALDIRDAVTKGHSQRVAEETVKLAQAVGVPKDELDHIRRGALLHDIGKIGIPDDILKKPGPLTAQERETIEQHPLISYRLLEQIDYLQPALDIPRYHHEKWDGSGYPEGLAGEKIPLAARIFAIVDVSDALSSDRPYRQSWEKDHVKKFMLEQSGSHFDPKIIDIFFQQVWED